MEPGRRYADDGERMPADLNGAAHHAKIVGKMALPIRVREHDIGCAVGATVIGAVEETAEKRLEA